MADADGPWILDTSVAAAWFFEDDPAHARSLRVREHLADRAGAFAVPHLFHAELVHVLARKSGRNEGFVAAALRLILRLGLRTIPLREAALVATAAWACKGLGGYDATYVALGEDLGARWITADRRAAKIAGPGRAVALDDWPS